jgi:tryptophan 2,3-dioxygenase
MEQAAVEALKRSKISVLALKEGMPSFAYVLFNPKSVPWPKPIRQAMLAIAKEAKVDAFRYEQVNDLLRLFFEIIENKTQNFNVDAVKTILKHREFTSALWAGATSRAIQFRMLNLYLGYRSALIKAEVSEHYLPLTPELQAAASRAQAQVDDSQGSQSPTNAEVVEESDLPPQ